MQRTRKTCEHTLIFHLTQGAAHMHAMLKLGCPNRPAIALPKVHDMLAAARLKATLSTVVLGVRGSELPPFMLLLSTRLGLGGAGVGLPPLGCMVLASTGARALPGLTLSALRLGGQLVVPLGPSAPADEPMRTARQAACGHPIRHGRTGHMSEGAWPDELRRTTKQAGSGHPTVNRKAGRMGEVQCSLRVEQGM